VLLLYGTYQLASKTLHEFALGLRKNARWRRASDGSKGKEPEPLMHFFWRSSQLGVPAEQMVGADDIDFFCELLGAISSHLLISPPISPHLTISSARCSVQSPPMPSPHIPSARCSHCHCSQARWATRWVLTTPFT
jgi:hypothetical protein